MAATIYRLKGFADFLSRLSNFQQTASLAALLLSPLLSFSVYAKPFVEKTERFEWDWSSMKLRFYGESRDEKSGQSYPELRKQAWQEGLMTAREKVADYHKKHLLELKIDATLASQSGEAAGNRTASSTWGIRSEFHSLPGQGSLVRIHMESSLARALQRKDIIFPLNEASPQDPEAAFSGLVLRSTAPVPPRATYRLVDQGGKVLFSITDVAKDAYEKNLMGRWFVNPDRRELSRAVGSRPLSLEVSPGSGGDFVVQNSAWQKAMPENRGLLERARIAIALPSDPPGR